MPSNLTNNKEEALRNLLENRIKAATICVPSSHPINIIFDIYSCFLESDSNVAHLIKEISEEHERNKIAPWMKTAKNEIGVYERDMEYGYGRVKQYYIEGAGQSLHPIKHAWCSSFANWVLLQTNKNEHTAYSTIPRNCSPNNPALAINFINKDRYPGGKIIPPSKRPPYGAIAVMKRLNSHQGHVGFVTNFVKTKDGFTITLLGGNQTHLVKYQSFHFKKVGSEFIYNNSSSIKGYVLPQEYIFDENDNKYYNYNKKTATKGTTR